MVIDSYGRYIGTDPRLSKEELSGAENPKYADNQAVDEVAKRKYLRVAML